MSTAEKIPVIFRYIEKEVIAILPNEIANSGKIMIYVRVGQHAEACRNYVRRGRLAKPDEYKALYQELCAIYEPEGQLVLRKRISNPQKSLV